MKKTSFFALLSAGLLAGAHSGQAQAFIGLQATGTALSSYSAPGTLPTSYNVTGLTSGDTLVDIDYFTSSTGVLYGMSNSGTLYSLAQTGATYTATVASTANVVPGGVAAIDFNPMANRLRIFTSTVTGGNNNYRLTPGVGGTFTPDGTLMFASGDVNAASTPSLIGAAYNNNYAGPMGTTLYSLDINLNTLNFHTGTGTFNLVNTLGPLTLGVTTLDITANTGFDISSIGGVNIAYLSSGNNLFTVNLANGNLTLVGAQLGFAITDIAFIPEPGTYAMLAVGGFGLAMVALRRRRQATAA